MKMEDVLNREKTESLDAGRSKRKDCKLRNIQNEVIKNSQKLKTNPSRLFTFTENKYKKKSRTNKVNGQAKVELFEREDNAVSLPLKKKIQKHKKYVGHSM